MADVEMLCCRKENESLLQKFVSVNVYSTRSVRRMMSHDVRSGRVKLRPMSVVSVTIRRKVDQL